MVVGGPVHAAVAAVGLEPPFRVGIDDGRHRDRICIRPRFKQNIAPINGALEKLMRINGVEYEMNAAAFPNNNFRQNRQIGLLAQNVEQVVPSVVNELDGYKGVDYAKLVPLLIEALKEQQEQRKQDLERIEKLEQMIKELRAKN